MLQVRCHIGPVPQEMDKQRLTVQLPMCLSATLHYSWDVLGCSDISII